MSDAYNWFMDVMIPVVQTVLNDLGEILVAPEDPVKAPCRLASKDFKHGTAHNPVNCSRNPGNGIRPFYHHHHHSETWTE